MPNRNSYLALGLTEDARHKLHTLAIACSDRAAAEGCEFMPMDFKDLHMTFFFMGEALHALPREQLVKVHAAIECAVTRAGLEAPSMHFDGLDLFPPGKTNLIVAKFLAPPALIALQREVQAEVTGLGVGRSGSVRQQLLGEDCWTPHCTLGKLKAKSSQVAAVGSRVIKQADCSGLRDGMHVAGVIMAGETPRQAWLDWVEALRFGTARDGAEAEDVCMPECIAPCVGSTRALQRQASVGSEGSELKRSVSFYLGAGSSEHVEEVSVPVEDCEPHLLPSVYF